MFSGSLYFMKAGALPWVPRKCLHKKTQALRLIHLKKGPYREPSTDQELSLSSATSVPSENAGLEAPPYSFRFKFSSRPAVILFALKVVLLVLISLILLILSSRSPWALPLLESSSNFKELKKCLDDSCAKMSACFICSSSPWPLGLGGQ